MKCDICDREDDLISFNKREQRFSPCTTCQAVIQDCIDGYPELDYEPGADAEFVE